MSRPRVRIYKIDSIIGITICKPLIFHLSLNSKETLFYVVMVMAMGGLLIAILKIFSHELSDRTFHKKKDRLLFRSKMERLNDFRCLALLGGSLYLGELRPTKS